MTAENTSSQWRNNFKIEPKNLLRLLFDIQKDAAVAVDLKFVVPMVRCGCLMARWKAENERSSMELSKRYGSGFSWQESQRRLSHFETF